MIYVRSQERDLKKQEQSRNIIVFFLIFVVVLFSIGYILQANSVVSKGYSIQKYKKEISYLQSQNKLLELRLSDARSLSFLEEQIKTLNMVKAKKIDYLSTILEVAAK